MKFWIKKYPKGEVGKWLHSKKVGDTIEIRGPLMTWPWQDDIWDEIVMISGGTGITPFYQLLHHTLLSSQQKMTKTRFTLLHSSRTPHELPPADILQPLLSHAQAYPQDLRVTLYVDSLDETTTQHPDLRVSRIGKPDILSALGVNDRRRWWSKLFGNSSPSTLEKNKKILVLVCGPDSMVAAIAGPLGRNMSQGPVSGILGELGLNEEQVWKV
ncbi:unnamed protein product [Somion occarium]